MRLSARKLLAFSAQFLVLFLLFLWLYSLILPFYNHLVLGLANSVLGSLTPPMRVEASSDNSWQVYLLPIDRQIFRQRAASLNLMYLNLALLPALLLATPTTVLRRFQLVGLGLSLLIVVHVISVIVLVRATVCTAFYDPRDLNCIALIWVFGAGGQLFGVALWALLSWRLWFPKPLAMTAVTPAPQLQQKKRSATKETRL